MDDPIDELLDSVREQRAGGKGLYEAAAAVWRERRDSLPEVAFETLEIIGYDTLAAEDDLRASGIDDEVVRRMLGAGAPYDPLGVDEQARARLAWLGFLTQVAGIVLGEDVAVG